MKRNLLFFGAIFGLTILASCGSDDGPSIPPIVGEWEGDEFEISVDDPAFNSIDGTDDDLYGESSYVFEFDEDGSYERELQFSTGRLEDEGEWEIDGDELELDPDNSNTGLIDDFEIISVDADELVLAGEANFRLLPNTIIDTVTTIESFNALIEEFGQVKTAQVTLTFERD